MIKKNLKKLCSNPVKYIPYAGLILQQRITFLIQRVMSQLFQNTSFFLQGQMDINPKSEFFNKDFVDKTGGRYPLYSSVERKIYNIAPGDNTRRDMLILLLRTIVEKKIEGNIAELGVYKGYTAKLFHHYIPERFLYLFDTFDGFGDQCIDQEEKNTGMRVSKDLFTDTSLDSVKKYISPRNDNVLFYEGYFPENLPKNFKEQIFSFVHLDADLYEPTLNGLKYFYPLVSSNGMIVVHDYNSWPGARQAVDEFFREKNELPIPMPDRSGSVLIVKD